MTDSCVYILGKAEAEVDLAREALQGRKPRGGNPQKWQNSCKNMNLQMFKVTKTSFKTTVQLKLLRDGVKIVENSLGTHVRDLAPGWDD